MQQMTINLERSLVQQFPSFMDVVRASVYNCGAQFKNIAADLDMSTSELSRRLSTTDDLPFRLEDLPRLIKATADHRPVYWLVETFIEDADSKRKRALDDLSKMMPQIHAALRAIEGNKP